MSKLAKRLSVLCCALVALIALVAGVVALPAPAKAETPVVTISEKAEVRLYGEQGLRFIVTVNKAEVEKLTADDGAYAGYTASVGALLIPTDMLGENALTVATENVLNIPLVNRKTDGDTIKYNAVLTKIPESQMSTAITATAYVAFAMDGVQTEYVYAETSTEKSIAQVAKDFYLSGDADDEELEILADMLKVTDYELAIDKAIYQVAKGDSFDVNVIANELGFIPNDIVVTSDNAEVASVSGLTVTGVANGTANITVTSGDQVKTAIVHVDENYLETFDNASIVESVSHKWFNENFKCETTAEYLDEYEGEYGVLKVTGISSFDQNAGINFGFGVALKEVYKQSGYTLKYRVEQISDENGNVRPGVRYLSVDDGFRYENETSTWLPDNSPWQTTNADKYGQWITQYCAPSGDTTKDLLGFTVSTVGKVDGVFGGWAIYIAFAMDGDQTANVPDFSKDLAINKIKSELKDGELLNCDSDDYKYLVSYYDHVDEARAGTVNNAAEVKVEVEVLDKYEGEQSVLKISGSQATNSSSINLCVGITLPKAYTNGYTIRWRIEEQDASNLSIRYITVDDGFRYANDSSYLYDQVWSQWGGLSSTVDGRYNTWHTTYCSSASDTTKDKLGFVFSTLNKGGWTLYISYVMDGDTTNA